MSNQYKNDSNVIGVHRTAKQLSSAYYFFISNELSKFKEKHPNLTQIEIVKSLTNQWIKLNFTEKPKYITLANVKQHQNDKAEVDKAYELGLTPEQPELEKTIILEALSKKRQAKNSEAIGSYLEELEKTTSMKALGLLLEKQADNDKLYALWLQDQTDSDLAIGLLSQEQADNNKALGLSLEKQAEKDKLYALWLQEQPNLATAMRILLKQQENDKATALLFHEYFDTKQEQMDSEQIKNDEAIAKALQEEINLEQEQIKKETQKFWIRHQTDQAMRLSTIEEFKNNITILEQQKINKFLNSLIKQFTLGTVNINNKIEIKISKLNEVLETQLKKAKEFEKLAANPSLFSKLCREVFDNQSINNEVANLSSKSGVKSISLQI